MMTAKNVAQQLAQRAEDVCMYLLPNGKKAGHEWCIGNLYGDVGDSLKIHLTGMKAGYGPILQQVKLVIF
jgi:twinkle protein